MSRTFTKLSLAAILLAGTLAMPRAAQSSSSCCSTCLPNFEACLAQCPGSVTLCNKACGNKLTACQILCCS